MKASHLIGSRVALTVSDPWEFSNQCGAGPFGGVLTDVNSDKALIVFDEPIRCGDTSYVSAIGQVRHQGVAVGDLRPGVPISMNVVLLRPKARRFNDLSNADFQGNIVALGTVELTKEEPQ